MRGRIEAHVVRKEGHYGEQAAQDISFSTTAKIEGIAEDEPCYVISVAARLVEVHTPMLRYYERIRLVFPARLPGNIRMCVSRDVHRTRWVKSLIDDLDINLASVDVIMRMSTRLAELDERVGSLTAKLEECDAA